MHDLRRLAGALQACYPSLDHRWWPVDHMHHAREGTDGRFEVMLGAILTQNTAWRGAQLAIENLRRHSLLAPDRAAAADLTALADLVRPAGTHNRKARYVQALARHVVDAHGGSVGGILALPTRVLRHELLSLRGIGPETTDAILVYAARRPSFIVDAYTRRLAHRFTGEALPTAYDEAQAAWTAAVGHGADAHAAVHAAIVEHAKATCTARDPRCGPCALRPGCAQAGVAQD